MEIIIEDTNEVLDIEAKEFHKYWKPQSLHNNCNVFIMDEEVEKEYEGYAVNYQDGEEVKWVFFWHDTVLKYGDKTMIPGRFNDKEFYRINIANKDGHAKQIS